MEKQREYQGRRKVAASKPAKKSYLYKFFIQCLVSAVIFGISVLPLKPLGVIQNHIKSAINYKVNTEIISSALSKFVNQKTDKNTDSAEVQIDENEEYTEKSL